VLKVLLLDIDRVLVKNDTYINFSEKSVSDDETIGRIFQGNI